MSRRIRRSRAGRILHGRWQTAVSLVAQCHDPHNQPLQPAKHYAACCKSCYEGRLPKSHPVGNGNCVACHMPRREAKDGGHSVFTDHRIARRPQVELQSPEPGELVAWREPEMALQQRNLALAYVTAGITDRSPVEIVHGYRMLTEVQQ